MFAEIDKHVSKCSPLSLEELDLFHASLKLKQAKKKTFLLQPGEVCNFEAYIIKGCIKKYFLDINGHEVILHFAVEDWWVSDICSFYEQKPSNLFIETLEDCQLLTIDHYSKERLFERIPKLERVFRMMIQRSYSVFENRFFALVSQTAEERYIDFIKKYPAVANRVPQQQIAAFLGVTPESLSRIKSKLLKKRR